MSYAIARRVQSKGFLIVVLAFLGLVLSGCPVRFVADYDQKTADGLEGAYRKIAKLYDELRDTPSGERTYSKFAGEYGEIEADLRALLLRQQVRSLNEESRKLVERILEQFQKDRQWFKDGKVVMNDPTLNIQQAQFEGLFRAYPVVTDTCYR